MMDGKTDSMRTTSPYSLSVGVTANRWRNPGEADNMRLNPAHRHSLEETLRHVLIEINRAVDLHYRGDAPQSLYATSTPPIRLVSPLAEGGDRVVATVATTLDHPWDLLVITPEDISILPDRDPHVPLLPLWNSANERMILGGTQLDDESLLDVNRQLLTHSGLLVSLWDNQPARGEAGTENVIKQALAQNIPVIVIDAEPTALPASTPHAFRVMTPDDRVSNDDNDQTLRDVVAMLLARVG
ncbi:MAG: hypothetical protein ABI120_00335 [Gemmatimonadaceae bacterium]